MVFGVHKRYVGRQVFQSPYIFFMNKLRALVDYHFQVCLTVHPACDKVVFYNLGARCGKNLSLLIVHIDIGVKHVGEFLEQIIETVIAFR